MKNKLTLKSVETNFVSLPLKRPIISKVGIFNHWPVILINLKTKEGIVGHSYLEPYLEKAVNYIIPAVHDLAEFRLNKNLAPMDDYIIDRKRLSLVGLSGISMIAVAGLDMAAWDALSKASEMPLVRFLGGTNGEVSSYNSNGLWLSDINTLQSEAKALVKEGNFNALKLRLGREKVEEDIKAINLIRDAVGKDINLMVDFNQGRTFGEALERCHALDDFGLYWFEEPIIYDNFRGYADLKRQLKTPLQIGENFYGPRDVHNIIECNCCDYIMPDMMRIGGVTGWLRSTPIASAAGIQVSSHLYPEVSAHLMRITETAHWLEWQDWVNPILEEPFKIKNGKIEIPERDGIGISWNKKALKKYKI